MKIKKLVFLALIGCFLQIGTLHSQNLIIKRANKLYQNQEYFNAAKLYKQYLETTQDIKAYINLANCYRLTNNTVEAERLYEIIVKSNEALPIHYFYYAQVLKSNQKYDQAKKWFIEYFKTNPDDKDARMFIKTCDNINQFSLVDSVIYSVYNININSPESDFAPIFYNDGILYVSARKSNSNSKHIYGRTGEPFLDIYYSKDGFKDKFRDPVSFSDVINSRFHEGPVSFSPNNEIIFFTRNNFLDGKATLSRNGTNKLNIYTAKSQGESWVDVELFEVNSPEYSIGHPSLSEDGKLLFFVSDMPGGFGGTDIYVCKKLGFNWTKPVNLGMDINTPGNEMFPFVSKDGTLYFSSDGHPGLGGLDIFLSKFNGYKWDEPINIKAPFNSSKDDFSFIINESGEEGFFASNRDGGKGSDDIYHFIKNIEALKLLKGIVVNAKTHQPIADVKIVLQDFINADKQKQTLSNGNFDFRIDPEQNYNIVVSKSGFHTKTILFFALDYKNVNSPYLEIELDESIWLKLEGSVADAESNLPIENVNIELQNTNYNITNNFTTKSDGKFTFDLDPENKYVVVFSKEGYFTEKVEDLSTFGKVESEIIHYDVVLGLQKIQSGKAIEIKNILYDYNRWELRDESKTECNKIVNMLRNNPFITVEISSHTDSRGDDQYNMVLSQKRAESVVNYIISQGIESNRLVAKGYGETKLKNRCTNDVPCPESLHQENRRTEMKVISNK